MQFFRARRLSEPDVVPFAFDPGPALAVIDGLSFAEEGRYLRDEDDEYCCWPHDPKPFRRAYFARIRRKALPQIESQGKLSELPLSVRAGLAEGIHIRFFPDGVAGVVYNFHGPRMSRLGDYLSRKAPGPGARVEFEALIRPDLLRQLDELESVHLLELKLRRNALEAVRDPSLKKALEAAVDAGNAETVSLGLSQKPRSRRPFHGRILECVRGLFAGRREPGSDAHAGVERCIVGGVTKAGETATIDLLKEHVVSVQSIVAMGERSKVLDEASAFGAIERARTELEQEIRRAATLST